MNSNILLSIIVYLMMPAVTKRKDENSLTNSALDNDLIDNDNFLGRQQTDTSSDRQT